jgi:hypothetical protein
MGNVHRVVAIVLALVTGAVFAATTTSQPATTQPATTQAAKTQSTPAPPPTLGDLDNLLKQLQSDTWATRRHAADQIELLGEPARPILERRLKASSDAELSEALRILISKLNEARQYGATLVTLHLDKVPAHEALAALARRASVSFTPAPDTFWKEMDEPRVTFKCTDEPFWSSFQQIAAQAKLRMTGASPGNPITLATADPKLPAAPYAVAGPYLFKVKVVTNTRSATFEGGRDPNAASGCRISLFAWAEPKMSAAAWEMDPPDEIVTDATTRHGGAGPGYYTRGGQVGATFPGMLSCGQDLAGNRLIRVHTTARFTIVDKTEKFEVHNVLAVRKAERTIDGYVVQLKDVNKMVDDQYAFTVEISRGTHSVAEFGAYQRALDRWRAKLLDADGKPLSFHGGSGSYVPDKISQTSTVTRANGPGGKVGEPATFVWELPAHLKTLSFPVEFKDLPLP